MSLRPSLDRHCYDWDFLRLAQTYARFLRPTLWYRLAASGPSLWDSRVRSQRGIVAVITDSICHTEAIRSTSQRLDFLSSASAKLRLQYTALTLFHAIDFVHQDGIFPLLQSFRHRVRVTDRITDLLIVYRSSVVTVILSLQLMCRAYHRPNSFRSS